MSSMSMLSRLPTVFSIIISDPGIILFMPIIVSVSVDTRDSFTMRFGPLHSWPPGLSLLGFLRVEILGASAPQSRLRRVQQCISAAVQQCRVQAGGRVIFHIGTHTALHQGQLASFQCTINVWLQNKSFIHKHTKATLKLSVFRIPQSSSKFHLGMVANVTN